MSGFSAGKGQVQLSADPLPVTVEDAGGTAQGTVDNPLFVELTNGTQALPIDDITGALVEIDSVHAEIHEGHHFSVSYKNPDASPIADNGTIVWAITTGAQYLHIICEAAFGGDAELELREGATVQAGTATTPLNHNRASTAVSTATVVRDPTINNAGTLLENVLVPGGTGGNSIGTVGRQRDEWILNANTTYLIRATNRAGNAQPGSLRCSWYEEATS